MSSTCIPVESKTIHSWSRISGLSSITRNGHYSSFISVAVIKYPGTQQCNEKGFPWLTLSGPSLSGKHGGRDLKQLITSYPQSNAERRNPHMPFLLSNVLHLHIQGPCLGNGATCSRLDFPTSVSNQDNPPQT